MLRDAGLIWNIMLPAAASSTVTSEAREFLPALKGAINNLDGMAYWVQIPAMTTEQLPAGSDATPGAWELAITTNGALLPDDAITAGGITFTAALEPEGDTQFALDASASDIASVIKNKGLDGYTLTKYQGKVTYTENTAGSKEAPTVTVTSEDAGLTATVTQKTAPAPAGDAGLLVVMLQESDNGTDWSTTQTLGEVPASNAITSFTYFIPRITKRYLRIAVSTNATASDCSASTVKIALVCLP